MTKPHHEIRAEAARKALDAYASDASADFATRIQDLITDLGHLCDFEKLDFVERLRPGIRHWAVERIDPNSIVEGPVVEIYIGTEGLPQPPTPKQRKTKPKKVRVPR